MGKDKTEKQTPKQRYDAAMKESGYIRVQGWVKPENQAAVKSLLETKCGLDASAGEHLFKKGEIIPRNIKNKLASNDYGCIMKHMEATQQPPPSR